MACGKVSRRRRSGGGPVEEPDGFQGDRASQHGGRQCSKVRHCAQGAGGIGCVIAGRVRMQQVRQTHQQHEQNTQERDQSPYRLSRQGVVPALEVQGHRVFRECSPGTSCTLLQSYFTYLPLTTGAVPPGSVRHRLARWPAFIWRTQEFAARLTRRTNHARSGTKY